MLFDIESFFYMKTFRHFHIYLFIKKNETVMVMEDWDTNLCLTVK